MRPSRRIGGILALGAVFCALVPLALAMPADGRGSRAGVGGQRREPALEGTAAPDARISLEGARSQATAKRVRFDTPAVSLAAALGLLFVAGFVGIHGTRHALLRALSISGVTLRAPPRALSLI
ncbi:MAG: hypothetical protein JJE05_01255 [Actinobacteria bacterium]|nr:hypothetical protein [Actinomycetota bacterium]